MCSECVCVYVRTSKPIVPLGQQKNKNNKKQKKTKTKKQQQKKKQKQKNKNKKQKKQKNKKKVRKHHIFRRQTGRVSDTCCVKKSDSVFRTFFSKTHCRTFLHSSESPKSETLTNLKGCQNRRHLKGALLDGIVEGDPTTPPAELHTPKAIQ